MKTKFFLLAVIAAVGAAATMNVRLDRFVNKNLPAKMLWLQGDRFGDSAAYQFESSTETEPKNSILVSTTDRVAPVLLNGETENGITLSRIILVNTTDRPAQVLIEFFDVRGQRLSMPLMGEKGDKLGDFESLSGNVPARGVAGGVTFPVGADGSRVAYARFRSQPAGAVEVVINHLHVTTAAEEPADEDSEEQGAAFSMTTYLAEKSLRRATAYLVENPGAGSYQFHMLNAAPTTASVTVTARQLDGRILCRTALNLSTGQLGTFDPTVGACFSDINTFYIAEIVMDRQGLVTTAMFETELGEPGIGVAVPIGDN